MMSEKARQDTGRKNKIKIMHTHVVASPLELSVVEKMLTQHCDYVLEKLFTQLVCSVLWISFERMQVARENIGHDKIAVPNWVMVTQTII